MMEMIDDMQLAELIRQRRRGPTVKVDIDELIAEAEAEASTKLRP